MAASLSSRFSLNPLGSVRDPEFNQTSETGYDKQSAGSDGPTCHAASLGIGNYGHNDGQRSTNGSNHIPHPVDQVQYGAFRLSSGLTLHSLTSFVLAGYVAASIDGGVNATATFTSHWDETPRWR